MDIKTNERILKALLNLNDDINCIEKPILIVSNCCKNLDNTIIEASLRDLEDKLLIKNHYGDETIIETEITFKGIGYFREKQEKKINSIKEWAWTTLKWLITCIIPIAVGYYFGKH